jgi:hypothetical protein
MAKIAVIVRDSQSEALRMSVGLTVLNDMVDIFITEKLKKNNENSETHLETIRDLKLKIYSTISGSEFEYMSPEKMADKLLEYDRVLPY